MVSMYKDKGHNSEHHFRFGFCNPPLFWGCVLLYLRLPKGGCCSISDDLSCSCLDLLLPIVRDGHPYISIYDWRDDFNSHITNFPFLRNNIPSSPAYGVFISQLIQYARACSSYDNFPVSYSLIPCETLEIVVQEVLWSTFGTYSAIGSLPLTNLKWHSKSLTCYSDLPTDQTFHQLHDLDTEPGRHRITRGFHGAFVTGVVCQHRTLTLPDTWFRPFLRTYLCSNCWDKFYRICQIVSRSYLEYHLVLSRFCLFTRNDWFFDKKLFYKYQNHTNLF